MDRRISEKRPTAIWEEKGGSLSMLLDYFSPSAKPRLHLKRVTITLAAVVGIVACSVATRAKVWPEGALSNWIYQTHDQLFLPLWADLWTMIFPWGIMIWLPAATIALLLLWSWMSGKAPGRSFHRRTLNTILRLSVTGDVKETGEQGRAFALAVRLNKRLGLTSDFLAMIVRHERLTLFDQIEADYLAENKVSSLLVAKARNLLAVQGLLEDDPLQGTSRFPLEAMVDVAFLSHLKDRGDIPSQIEALLGENWNDKQAPARFGPLDAFLSGASVESCRSEVASIFGKIEAIEKSASGKHRVRDNKSATETNIEALVMACVFAFFKTESTDWMAISCAILKMLDRLHSALLFSDEHEKEATKLGAWIQRSRMMTICLMHDRTYRSKVVPEGLVIWPEDELPYWQLENRAFIAGGN